MASIEELKAQLNVLLDHQEDAVASLQRVKGKIEQMQGQALLIGLSDANPRGRAVIQVLGFADSAYLDLAAQLADVRERATEYLRSL